MSYAHYGCDPKRPAFRNVVWRAPDHFPVDQIDSLKIATDDNLGSIGLSAPGDPINVPHKPLYTAEDRKQLAQIPFHAALQPPVDPGDQTVPMHSADDQLNCGRFKGIFRQTGYEHQDSYQNRDAIASTLYSIVRIAQEMKWSAPCP